MTDKLEFGNSAVPEEYQLMDSCDGTIAVLNQNQAAPSLGSNHNLLFRRLFYLKDAKKIDVNKPSTPFDQFNFV